MAYSGKFTGFLNDKADSLQHASITLVGELLFKVSGISGKTSDGDDEEAPEESTVAESSRRALLEVLGAERRDRILSALYMVRQDGVVIVRQASIQIWKALVNNTPRTGKLYDFFLVFPGISSCYSAGNTTSTHQSNCFLNSFG